jgi:hypothetical protein
MATTNGLDFYDACRCAGTGCGGHLTLSLAGFVPAGYQGAAQHTCTRACDGFHEPGPCPERQQPHAVFVPART